MVPYVAPQHWDRNIDSLFIWEVHNLRGSKSHNLRVWLMWEFQILRKIYGELCFISFLVNGGAFQVLHITSCRQLPPAIRWKLVLMSNLIQENRPAWSRHGWIQGSRPLISFLHSFFPPFFFFSSSLSASYVVTVPLFMCHCAHAFSHTICIIKIETLGLAPQSSG